MKSSSTVSAALAAALLVSGAVRPAMAGPAFNGNELGSGYDFLMARANCDGTACGWSGQLCCSVGSACYTDANTEAQCSATSNGGWEYYTTTYVETDLNTVTSTWSSYTATVAASSQNPRTSVACQAALGESACGAICCASNQYCYQSGQCVTYGSSSYSAPLRPTSGTTVATTVPVTTTQPFSVPETATGTLEPVGSGSGGLSGGAIAGIVIGTIAGVALLLAICFCCAVRVGWDALMAIFGLGRRRKSTERVEVVEERYSRHGSHAGGRTTHGGWFGGRPARVSETRKKESGIGGLGMVGAGLAGLALILGLKRRHDRKEREKSRTSRSDYTYSDYTYTDSYTGTSESE